MSVDPSCKEEAERFRLEGKSHYERNEFEEAIQKYIQAGELYRSCGSEEWEAKMWGNVALMHMKLNQPTISLEYANRAVEMSPLNSKAYYRRAQALEHVNEYVGQC
ncbi:Heat shock protein sti1 homolog [Geodia barretti]|uniref:Heat shock protein sti1 homolog n=1 Tax=Geodia barretti TaxID=519541 RepID=A0AA35W7H4_GEOBA|nr:Heat shock protein sti1 homolog [Geodia barretti]